MPKRNEGARLRWFAERGAFYICWTIKHRSRKCSTGTADREQAEAFLADWLRDRGAGTTRPSDPSQSLITDCLSRYAEEHGPDVVGQETLGRAILHLIEFWQERVVSEITPILCKRYCTVRAVSNGTARRELGVLRAAVNWAYKNGRLTRAVAVALPDKPESKTRWLRRTEAARLLKASKTPDARSYMPLFILIGLYTGRRKEAILGLALAAGRLHHRHHRLRRRRPEAHQESPGQVSDPVEAPAASELAPELGAPRWVSSLTVTASPSATSRRALRLPAGVPVFVTMSRRTRSGTRPSLGGSMLASRSGMSPDWSACRPAR